MSDGNGSDTGYYVSFTSDGTPAGYVILSLLTEGSPVVEFSFDGTGPIEEASVSTMSKANAALYCRDIRKETIYTGADSLYIPLQNGDYFAAYQHEIVDISEYVGNEANTQSKSGSVDLYDGILDWSEANISSDSVFKIDKFGSGTDYWIMDEFAQNGKYKNHCAPTAATNILWYWGFKRGCSSITNKVSAQASKLDKAILMFELLRMGMRSTNSGTDNDKVISGYTDFFGSTTQGVWSFEKIYNGASFDKYETRLRRNLPIHLIVETNSFLPLAEGHSLMAIGVAESVSGEDYIFVMDGWNKYGRFVKFSYYPYIMGYTIVVNK